MIGLKSKIAFIAMMGMSLFLFGGNAHALLAVQVTSIDGTPDTSPLPAFSFVQDENLTIGLSAQGLAGTLLLSVEYSTSPTFGSGTPIVTDLDLSSVGTTGPYHCSGTNFLILQNCSIDWDLQGVPDDNYYINAQLTLEGVGVDADSSAETMMIDNTAPTTSWDGNESWQNTDAEVHLACSDGSGSGCGAIQYRVDSDESSDINWGDWTTYTGPLSFTSEGDYAIEFGTTDAVGNVETPVEEHVLIDKTNPTGYIYGPYEGFSIEGSMTTIHYVHGDDRSGFDHADVSEDGETWIGNGIDNWYTFTNLAEGNHTWYLRIYDRAGNMHEDSSTSSTFLKENYTPVTQVIIDDFETGDFYTPTNWWGQNGTCSVQSGVSHSGDYAIACSGTKIEWGTIPHQYGDASYSVWMRADADSDAEVAWGTFGNGNVMTVALNTYNSGIFKAGGSDPNQIVGPWINFEPEKWYLVRAHCSGGNFDISVYDSDGTTQLGQLGDAVECQPIDYIAVGAMVGNSYYDDAVVDFNSGEE